MAVKPRQSSEKPERRIRDAKGSPTESSLAAQVRRQEAEARRLELENELLLAKLARQPLEKELMRAQIEKGRAEADRNRSEARALDSRRLRSDALLVLLLVMVIFVLVMALINPAMLLTLLGSGALIGLLRIAGSS